MSKSYETLSTNVCRHGNYIGDVCHYCINDRRRRVGRLTIERYVLDDEYKRACKARGVTPYEL